MRFLRSLAFNIAFYVSIIVWMIILTPALLLPRPWLWAAICTWSRMNRWLLRVFAGVTVEMRGLENLPAGGCLIASKHQSAWETVSLLDLFHEPAFIMKRELMFVPLFGWFAQRMRQIPVDRARGRDALKTMTAKARLAVNEGRQILIYPEGTRRPPGAEPAYKYGIVHLYRELGVPVVPVALNSGLYWPRRGFSRHPGAIVIEFLPPIAPGLDGDRFFDQLKGAIEATGDRLLVEAADVPQPPPLSVAAAERVAQTRALAR